MQTPILSHVIRGGKFKSCHSGSSTVATHTTVPERRILVYYYTAQVDNLFISIYLKLSIENHKNFIFFFVKIHI